MRGSHLVALLAGASAGVAGVYLLDPAHGARHRALASDKVGHYRRLATRSVRRGTRSFAGPARGMTHRLTGRFAASEPPPDDNTFLKQRIESELGHLDGVSLAPLNFEAADGLVRVRGTVTDAAAGERIVKRIAGVSGVRAVVSLMHLSDGTPVSCRAGDTNLIDGAPRSAIRGVELRKQLMQQWPALTDDDILKSDGHLGSLAKLISERTGQPEAEIRPTLESTLLAAI